MTVYNAKTFRGLDKDAIVRAILEGTGTETGERFFAALVECLAKAVDTYSFSEKMVRRPDYRRCFQRCGQLYTRYQAGGRYRSGRDQSK